jgi:Ca2+-binding RTX toxin-like protein
MAWKVLAADTETLTIGDPDDGDVGVLSYDPESEHFLLDGVDTGVTPVYRGNLPNVLVSTGNGHNTKFVIDAFDATFPALGPCVGFCTSPGVSIDYDGGGTGNTLAFRGHETYTAGIAVRPFIRGLGAVTFLPGFAANHVSYRNFFGKITLEMISYITIDVSSEFIHDPEHPTSTISRNPRQTIQVGPDRIIVQESTGTDPVCNDPPSCRQFIGPDIVTGYDILNLERNGARDIRVLAGNGNDRISISSHDVEPGYLSSNVTVYGGDASDTVEISGSEDDDWISISGDEPPCFANENCSEISFPYVGSTSVAGGVSVRVASVEHRIIHGNGGNDVLVGSKGVDRIFGGAGNDLLVGLDGDDVVHGGDDEGEDVLLGGEGNDTLDSGPGDDLLTGGSGDFRWPIGWTCTESMGSNFCHREPFYWRRENWNGFAPSNEDPGDDHLIGGDGDDLLFGTAGGNLLRGGRGNDVLIGANGNDHLDGGDGRNLLIGGLGSDTILSLGSDIVITGRTTIDTNQEGLRAILAEWSADRPETVRIQNLTDGSGGGDRLNGDHFLNSATVSDDGDADRVSARREIDWLMATGEDLIATPRPRRRRSAAFRR